ncbi:MAG TPA: hypothetical protein VHR72_00045 [Gemmataceae bacterium]|jgi:hypothetical protein|nr:hypothetical protein [Gemmataceae bacterium]
MESTTEDRGERFRTFYFLTHPEAWEVWPYLPLVRRAVGDAEVSPDNCGLLYDVFRLKGTTGYGATVIHCNLFMLPPTEAELLAMPQEVFDTFDELYAAGWRID